MTNVSSWFDKHHVLVEFTVSQSNRHSEGSMSPETKSPEKDVEIFEVSVSDPQLKEKLKQIAM